MDSNETYVYKSEVNWSLLTEGLTLPVDNQVVFARNIGNFLLRGEAKAIMLYLNGKGYRAQIRNVNFDSKFKRKDDNPANSYIKIFVIQKSSHQVIFYEKQSLDGSFHSVYCSGQRLRFSIISETKQIVDT